jgi:hypothetical protein
VSQQNDRPLPARLRTVRDEHIGDIERSLLMSWAAFAATFGSARGVTHALRRRGGSGGLVIGGKHLHHYNFGIILLAVVGGIGINAADKIRGHPTVAVAYGSGAALIVDEFALLLDLEDVYWATDGRKSVDVAVGLTALGGIYAAATSFWRAAAREVKESRRR